VFRELTVHGATGAILFGSRVVADLRAWRISKVERQWVLHATVVRVDRFQARQSPLSFTAPRAAGFWCWPITALDVGETSLRASLGPPER
jgi:hypothetical protein